MKDEIVMSQATHADVTCHNCNLNYIAKIADAPICPRCSAVYVAKGKHFKHIYEDNSQRGVYPIFGFKTEQTREGIVLSWRDQPLALSIWMVIYLSFCLIMVLIMPIATIISYVLNDRVWFVLLGIPLSLVTFCVIFYFVVRRHKIIITDTQLIDRALPKHTQVALDAVEDVFVRRLRESVLNKKRYAYQIYLRLVDGIHPIAIFRNEQVAAMIAHRLKVVLQLPLQGTNKAKHTPKAKKRTTKQLNWRKAVPDKPVSVQRRQNETTLDLQWTIERGNRLYLVVPIAIILLGCALLVFGYVDNGSESVLSTLFGIFALVGGLIWLSYTLGMAPTRGIVVNQNELRPYVGKINNPTKQVKVHDLKQLHVVSNVKYNYVRWNIMMPFVVNRYALLGLGSGLDTVVQLGRFKKLETALYIEQEIEQFLGIEDKRVVGEAFE